MTIPSDMFAAAPGLVAVIEKLHREILAEVRASTTGSFDEQLVARQEGAGDVSFKIDLVAERVIERVLAEVPEPVVLVAEGIGRKVFPEGAAESDARYLLLVDPVDGTRELSAGKRSAWVLSGLAPNRGVETSLADTQFALQTELPIPEQGVARMVYAAGGKKAYECHLDADSGALIKEPFRLFASGVDTIRGGYAAFADYFPGSHELTGKLSDEVFREVLGAVVPGKASVYNDQYISSGGWLYMLASGRYRFCADLRPILNDILRPAGRDVGLCAHPYDLSTFLIATEAGAIVEDWQGNELSYAADTGTNCTWLAYANKAIQNEMSEVVRAKFRELAGASMTT